MSSNEINIRDDPDNDRYVAEIDGEVAAFTVYHVRRGPRYFFVHTEVSPEFDHRGIGSALARYALDDVISKGGMIVPICPFIFGWIEHHPEYKENVDQVLMDRINGVMRAQDSSD